jgi:SAM-dependent methyltransferase
LRFSEANDASYAALLSTLSFYRTSGRILDVGCGAGQFLTVARAAGWEPHGVEVAGGVHDALLNRGLSIFDGELAEAAFSDGWFDVVHCAEVIEHVLEPVALLREMERVLRPGGLLYLTTPNYDSVSRRLLGTKWRVLCREHISYFTVRVLTDALARSGFESPVVETRNIDPHECGKLFRRAAPPGAGFQAEAVDVWRRRTTRQASLRLLKRGVNGILALTSSGDTIIARATKPARL